MGIKTGLRALAIAAAMVGGAVASSIPASAEVYFEGFSRGCFGNCIPGAPGSSPILRAPDNTSALIYDNNGPAGFNGMTAGGYLAIGNSVTPLEGDNFGYFALTQIPLTYTGTTFNLGITFLDPAGVSNPILFSATLIGAVAGPDQGGVRFDFDNTPRIVSFLGGQQFSLIVDDVSVSAGRAAPITGFIQTLTTPVPGPIAGAGLPALMALGGFVWARRRKAAVPAAA